MMRRLSLRAYSIPGAETIIADSWDDAVSYSRRTRKKIPSVKAESILLSESLAEKVKNYSVKTHTIDGEKFSYFCIEDSILFFSTDKDKASVGIFAEQEENLPSLYNKSAGYLVAENPVKVGQMPHITVNAIHSMAYL